jgi:hypothetical protein
MPTTKTLVDTDSAQTLTNKTLTAPTLTAAAVTLAAAPVNALDAATKGYADGLTVNPINNGSLAASVSSNILTIALKTASGGTPSASDPVRITFRNAIDTDGSLVTRTVTSAVTMTCASGSSLGTVNGVAARLWVGLIDNSGTVELCIWNPLINSTLSLRAFAPNTDVSTLAEGSGTATSAQQLFSTNARTLVPFILLGFIEITEAAAGVWATAPTVVQTYRDGYRKTGDIIQQVHNVTGAVASGTTIMPNDDTIPQITEGDQYMTQAIIPMSGINLLEVAHQGNYANSDPGFNLVTALFRDATPDALAAFLGRGEVAGAVSILTIRAMVQAGGIATTTFRSRTGCASASTTTFNGVATVRKLGGLMASYMRVTEIMV